MSALRVRLTTGFFGSFEKTWILLEMYPVLPDISILASIFPFSPGFRRLELATTAAHPQEGVILLMVRSSDPELVNSNV